METTTPFDLNRAIEQWRAGLAQSPAFRRENLNELESHLRDSIASLQSRGLSAEEAFLVATRRIGRGSSLETEFAKVNARAVWLDRILWMLIGLQVWGLVSSLIGSVARNALALGWRNTNNHHMESGLLIPGLINPGVPVVPVALFTLVQLMATAASIALCWWLIVRKGQRFGAWLGPLLGRRSTLVAMCAALSLFSLVGYSLPFGIQVFFAKSYGPVFLSRIGMYSGISKLITWPIQVAATSVLTLVLARKRLSLNRA